MEDTDAADGPRTHWLVYDIPAELKGLLQGPCGLCKLGRNDFQGAGYVGPQPHPADPQHRYSFRLYALDADSLGIPAGVTRAGFQTALAGHVLATAQLTGVYGQE